MDEKHRPLVDTVKRGRAGKKWKKFACRAIIAVANGAPLRLRLERQLGYKMAKYVMCIELVEDFSRIAGGKGGYWQDQGYEWYAGL